MALVTYLPRTMPTLGGDQLYLQQELASIANAIGALNNTLKGYEAAWTAYTPTVTPDTGTIGSASATGRYLKIGKIVHIQLVVHVTTVGTGGGYLNVTLPFNTAGLSVIAGWENAITGKMCQGETYGPSTALQLRMYDNTSPIVANYNLLLGGVYECV